MRPSDSSLVTFTQGRPVSSNRYSRCDPPFVPAMISSEPSRINFGPSLRRQVAHFASTSSCLAGIGVGAMGTAVHMFAENAPHTSSDEKVMVAGTLLAAAGVGGHALLRRPNIPRALIARAHARLVTSGIIR